MTSEPTVDGLRARHRVSLTRRSSRRAFTRGVLGGIAILLVSAPVGFSADDSAEEAELTAEPTQIIEKAAGQIMAVLARKDEPAEVRVREIEEIAYAIFDFTTMSKLVLARNWRKMDKPKRAEFVREFKTHLSRTYGTRLDRYDQEEVEVYGAQVEVRNDVTVKSRIVGGQFDGAEIAYRLRNRKDAWKIIDVVIEGVSLVSNYRSQFATVLNGGTIDDLITKLKDKNFVVDQPAPEKGQG
ncbi:MAG: ABC transporter substrate-binding protein [bacterium]|nr:ABC transporter substrate-binding protein [bacterium]